MLNPCEFLVFAGGSGLSVVAGIAFSFLVENWAWFGNLPPKGKRIAFLVICIVVGGIVTGLSYIPGLGCVPLGWWTVLLAVYNAFLAFGGGTMAATRKL